MRLVCRECSAAYEAPDSLFGAQPREVRCNRCGFQWTVVGAVKAMPAGPQPAAAPSETSTVSGRPPELMHGPSLPPVTARTEASAAVAVAAAPPLAQTTTALADHLAGGLPDPLAPKPAAPDVVVAQPVVAPLSPATRSLLTRHETEDETELAMGDPEERRLSHELSFGETERAPVAHRPSRGLWRGFWMVVMIVIILVIAAILFKPQILGAVPALDHLYAAVGL